MKNVRINPGTILVVSCQLPNGERIKVGHATISRPSFPDTPDEVFMLTIQLDVVPLDGKFDLLEER